MADYFVLECFGPRGKEHFTLEVDPAVERRMWRKGVVLSQPAEWEDEQPPDEPIQIDTVPEPSEPELFVYPELTWVPIPLMTRRLVQALQRAGVDNLQTFLTNLRTVEGDDPPAADTYLAVNIIGAVAGAGFEKARVSPTSTETLVSIDFNSLAIDEAKVRSLLMFRLAENTTAVVVHEQVKQRLKADGLETLKWVRPEQWAG
jgi:hypothetical protein